jgi:hypothetical protein
MSYLRFVLLLLPAVVLLGCSGQPADEPASAQLPPVPTAVFTNGFESGKPDGWTPPSEEPVETPAAVAPAP